MSKQSWKTKTFKKLRNIQDRSINSGWRIEMISHAPKDMPIIIGFENWAGCLAVISAIGFVVGCIMEIKDQDSLGIYIVFGSFSVCLFALGMKIFLTKKDWIFVRAKCLDREVTRVRSRNGGSSYGSRVLCEFNYNNVSIQCTPVVHWTTQTCEDDAHELLNSRIDPDGECILKANPNNFKEANLAKRSKEVILMN